MVAHLDPVFLARAQFAFTVAYHITFPAFTIGLASWLAMVEWRWLKTGNPLYEQIYRMWAKIFAVTFGMGVVTGVVLSYQFGTNWSVFADKVGSVLGPLLGYEVLTAFFLEASFLGIMLFGWNRVSKRMHFTATVIVAAGTLISAFWILSANSWMQTPTGFREGADGLLYPTNWIQVIFNPSFPYRLIHMVTAAYLTTAFVVGGIGGYYLWRGLHVKHARIMLGMAMIMAIFVAPMQLLFGDLHGLNTFKHQPVKVAAMEGIWETEQGAALRLFAWPDQIEERNRFEITIPKLSSLILTHDLKPWKSQLHPGSDAMQFTGIGMGIHDTGAGVSRHEQFQRNFPGHEHPGGGRVNHHPFGNGRMTRGHQSRRPFHLHHADSADAGGFQFLPVAQGGDMDPHAPGHRQNGLPRFPFGLQTVYHHMNLSHPHFLRVPGR